MLHDLDITGLNIAHTISNSNERYRFQNDLDVHDMGVRLHDAEALGLQSEPFRQDERVDRQKLRARLERYGATPGEIRMLVDEARRVEIDAMDVGQLVNFIEQKLAAASVGKIVPPEEAMAAHFAQAASQIRIDRALIPLRAEFDARAAAFAEDLRAGPLLEIEVPRLREAVAARLAQFREQTWREAVAAVAEEREGAR